MNFHRLNKAKDKNFWSVRVNDDIRLIVHKSEISLLLCYVGHHDKAYDWAERRRLETHPKTGAAQLVEIRETVQEILIPTYVEAPKPAAAKLPLLFAGMVDDDLLAYGVPPEYLSDVHQIDEDNLLSMADRLPAEAAEALLELATGGKPLPPQPGSPTRNPLDHPDAQRRFRVMSSVEELQRALEFPWDRWSVFLHPEQRQLVERDYTGSARVSGSAGTGKTIVALHRAVFLARSNQNARVLLTTFSHMLANALRTQLRRLISNEPRLAERLEVHSINATGERLYKSHFGQINLAAPEVVQELLRVASERGEKHKFSVRFLLTEWEQVVDAWQLDTWEAYRDVARLGRKTRLPEAQREILWAMFEQVREGLAARNMITRSAMFTKLGAAVAESRTRRLTSLWSMRRKISEWPISGSSRGSIGIDPPRFSSLATSASASSSSRSRGWPWAWIFGAGRRRCGSITARHIRSGCRQTDCSVPRCPMPMATGRSDATPSPSSMARHRRFKFCAARKKKLNTLASGYQDVRRTVSRPTSLVSSCDPPQNWAEHGWLCSSLNSRSKF